MEEKYYSIGETARIMGLSVQALRYYNKMGLVEPSYVNEETGYRYYTFNQFHYIDRIRYLQDLGLSLSDITKILSSGRVDQLLNYLKKQKIESELELQKIQAHIDDIQWYIDYFTYIETDSYSEIPYKKMLNRRYLIIAPCYPHDSNDDYHVRLSEIRNSEAFQDMRFRRQYAYVLDFDSLMRKELNRLYLGMYLRDAPGFASEHVLELPAGEYLCFQGRILTGEWDPSLVAALFRNRSKPALVLSNEYENSLVDYKNSMYEIQILLRESP